MVKQSPSSDVLAAVSTPLEHKPPAVRVLQIHTDTAWEYGLADFLRQQSGLKVRSVMVTRESILLSDLARFNPDVILLNKDVPLSLAHLRTWLGGRPVRSAVRLIVINLYDNIMDIYDSHQKRQVTVTQSADLSECVRGLYPD